MIHMQFEINWLCMQDSDKKLLQLLPYMVTVFNSDAMFQYLFTNLKALVPIMLSTQFEFYWPLVMKKLTKDFYHTLL